MTLNKCHAQQSTAPPQPDIDLEGEAEDDYTASLRKT